MSTYYEDDHVRLYHGDCLDVLRALPDASVDCCVTSPPYFGLRDYGSEGQYGLEASPAEYVETMRALFSEVRRVLADDGTLWLNIGDSYANDAKWGGSSGGKHVAALHGGTGVGRGKKSTGLPPKSLMGIPWRVAFALQDDGWILRNDIIWAKPNGMPESIKDRLSTKHEHVFMLAKSTRYWFDLDPIREQYEGDRDESRRARSGATNKANSVTTAWGGDRAQKRRAAELFEQAGLTDAHIAAMRAVGMSDAGKALSTQTGAGKNAAETQRLADEAKAALGGYYREFLYDGGRNPGDVWTIPTQPFPGAHFAVMPIELARRAILAGCKPGGTVLDPFSGSGTTGLAAQRTGRKYVGIDLNADYLDLSLRTRLSQGALDLEGMDA